MPDPSTSSPRHPVPFLLPILAGSPIIACMAIVGLAELGFEHAVAVRGVFVTAFVLWSVPLTALQRALWRRVPMWVLVLVMLATGYVFSVINNAVLQLLAIHWGRVSSFNPLRTLAGLDGCWLAYVAFCAIHAIVSHAYELRGARERLHEAEALAREAELRALRYQINPHFLFNTLNAISALVAERRTDDATRMLSTLGDLLRTTLEGDHSHEVTLAEELATTTLYLDIEKARLGERLVLDVRAGPDVLRARVPSLLIQPLVENAIRHGIARLSEPGRIELRVARDRDTLDIAIRNDGPPPDRRDTERPGAIGVANVRERLSRLYGDAQRFDVDIAANGGCRVRIVLPFRVDALPEVA